MKKIFFLLFTTILFVGCQSKPVPAKRYLQAEGHIKVSLPMNCTQC